MRAGKHPLFLPARLLQRSYIFLSLVERREGDPGAFGDILVRQWLTVELPGRPGGESSLQFPAQLPLLVRGQSFELFQNRQGLRAHPLNHTRRRSH